MRTRVLFVIAAVACSRRHAVVAEECPPKHAFSPAFPASDHPPTAQTAVTRRVCGGLLEADFAIEKVYVSETTGDGLSGRNGTTAQLWLLQRDGAVWRRTLVADEACDSGETTLTCRTIRSGALELAHDAAHATVSARADDRTDTWRVSKGVATADYCGAMSAKDALVRCK
jgi:hypothetical protein